MTQTVSKRNTIGFVATTSTSVVAGTSVTFSYVLHTAGAAAPTASSVQFLDGGANYGATQAITANSATNLIPYSQISTSQGWSTTGTAPTITPNAATGPDGSATSATSFSFPSTSSGTSGVTIAVPGTAYASTTLTMSVWAQSSANATLTLGLTDSPAANASGSNTCALTSAWRRCIFSLDGATSLGTGTINGSGVATITLSGANALTAGSHSLKMVYSGDTTYTTVNSNTLSYTVSKSSNTALAATSSRNPSIYGDSVTFTLTITSSAGAIPTGTIAITDGGSSIGNATLDGTGHATFSVTTLTAGSHSLVFTYSGDSNYN